MMVQILTLVVLLGFALYLTKLHKEMQQEEKNKDLNKKDKNA